MSKNQKLLIAFFSIILLAFVGNYFYQAQKHIQHKPTKKERVSLLSDKHVIDTLIMAKTGDPKYIDVVEKEYNTKKLNGRKLMVYAEKLGRFNTEKSVALMKRIYESTHDLKVKNRILMGLGAKVGGENQKFLMELYNKRLTLSELEKVYLYQSVSLNDHDKNIEKEINKFFTDKLNLQESLLNSLALRYFVTFKKDNKKAEFFSKEIINSALKTQVLSPMLFSTALRYLIIFDQGYLRKYHPKFIKSLPERFSPYYLNLVHHFCPDHVVQDLINIVNDRKVSFNLFRVASAEAKLFGGKVIYEALKKSSEEITTSIERRDFLKTLISKYSNMDEQKLCSSKK